MTALLRLCYIADYLLTLDEGETDLLFEQRKERVKELDQLESLNEYSSDDVQEPQDFLKSFLVLVKDPIDLV